MLAEPAPLRLDAPFFNLNAETRGLALTPARERRIPALIVTHGADAATGPLIRLVSRSPISPRRNPARRAACSRTHPRRGGPASRLPLPPAAFCRYSPPIRDRSLPLPPDTPTQLRLRVRLGRLLFRLALLMMIAFLANRLLVWSDSQAAALHAGLRLRTGLVAVLVVAYATLIAIPFVPGVELGFALMLAGGARLAPVIYLATVAGLLAAYLAGHLLPEARLRSTLEDLRLSRAAALVAAIAPLSRQERLERMQELLPSRLPAGLVRYRYVVLGLLVNLPGNSVLGGGGGILLLAGFSRLFGLTATLLTMLIAVLPVPLAIWLTTV